jgi:hypothetical protein
MNNQELALSLLSLGYNDYIAARVLLNKHYPLQGLTLASSAIEKYFKVILALHGNTKKDMGVHLDRLDKLKALLIASYSDITVHFDERFLNLLAKAYKARYYDNLSSPLMIGFFVNQVLCELDFIVNFFDNLIKLTDSKGEAIKSAYKRASENKAVDLITNNYLFLEISKKEFMERPDKGFGVYIDSINGFKEFEIEGTGVKNQYNGTIAEINLKFE